VAVLRLRAKGTPTPTPTLRTSTSTHLPTPILNLQTSKISLTLAHHQIDYNKFASVAGLKTAASARELMRVTKNKLKEEYVSQSQIPSFLYPNRQSSHISLQIRRPLHQPAIRQQQRHRHSDAEDPDQEGYTESYYCYAGFEEEG
jgi:hypothetical protein